MQEQDKDQQPSGNQAGPSSAPPETQEGLQETIQSGDKILAGARNDDQLQRLNEAAKNENQQDIAQAANESQQPESVDPE
jgi:hypothetical protein